MNRSSATRFFKVWAFVISLLIAATAGCRFQGAHLQNESTFNPIARDYSVIRDRLDNGLKFLLRPVRDGKTIRP
jgi:hypothetical protein